jgi:hypothetical protein
VKTPRRSRLSVSSLNHRSTRLPKDRSPSGDWWGSSACEANRQDVADYLRKEAE